MKELFRTHDPVLLSWATALLKDAGINCVVFDLHMGIMQGSIGAIERRLMVPSDKFATAQKMIEAWHENND